MASIKAHRIFGVAATSDADLVAYEPPSRRLSVIIQCDFDTGFALLVQWGEGSDSADWGHVELQPGESIVFSRESGFWWDGNIYLTGSGGTAGYRGAEIYVEGAVRRHRQGA